MKFLLLGLLPAVCLAGVWPDNIGTFHRTSAAPAGVSDEALWNEYGLQSAETATYENGASKFTATAWVLRDTTGALAAFDWMRPAQSKPSKVAELSAQTPNSLMLVHGNYLLSFQGYKPTTPQLDALAETLVNVDTTPLPTLPGFLPAENLLPNSERYVVGPVGLQQFDSGIPPSVAAFHLGAEAQLGAYRSSKGDIKLAIFDYPTPQIAMQRAADFSKLPGAMVKRSISLVAVTLAPPDPDAAERLLSQVRYQAVVTRDTHVPTQRDNIGNLIINVFVLIGILLIFAAVSGLVVGGYRVWRERGREDGGPDAMITLHLDNR
ncbi:MAG TPA: DUF6599 family protein [Bryobacteraceae bacterium]|nr:DUF6599 family protein [Bryobacteraceae bacterium]